MSRVRNGTTPGVLEALRWPNALERKIALRYMKGRRSRALSLNTVISIGGVAVGVMALIVVLGVMNGLRNDLRERILVANPHLRILTFGTGLRLDDWQRVLQEIRTEPGVVAAAPDVIVGSWCGKPVRPERIASRRGWNAIPAVRHGHIYEVKSALILQPGPAALTEGVRQLHERIARAI